MKKAILIFVIVFSFEVVSYGQDGEKHRIDKALEACIDKNSSTAGMVECENKAYNEWDKELNKNYNELMRLLDPDGKSALKAAQFQWLKFRDAEFKLIDSIYSKLDGTMYIPMRVDSRVQIIKNRAVELESNLSMTREGK